MAAVALAGSAALLTGLDDPSSGPRADVEPAAAAPVAVPFVTATRETIPLYYDYPGRTEAIRSLSLQSKVT